MIDTRLTSVMVGVRGVVFDKDGTLIDLGARWHLFFTDLVNGIVERSGDVSLVANLNRLLGLTETGLVTDGVAAVESAVEIGVRLIDEMVEHGHDANAATAIVVEAARVARFGPAEPIGDLDGALQTLALAGLRLGIATSDGVENTRDELELLGLSATFDPVCCADDGGPVKPDPAVLIGIAAAWSVPVSDLVFVGDSRQDLATARAAGARFVARCDSGAEPAWATTEADAIVTEIGELARVVHDGSHESEVTR